MNDGNNAVRRIHWQCNSLSINASAGFGKTEKLVIRLSALLLSDAAGIDSVLALTFSRAAAGEILGRLLQLLGQALDSDASFAAFRDRLRDSIAEEEAFAGVSPEDSQQNIFADLRKDDVLELLETLVHNMHRLNVGTLDSFFTRIIMCFPYELGLPGQVSMLPEQSSKILHRNLLIKVFSNGSDPAFAAFCRELMHGREKKSLLSVSSDIIDGLQEFYPYCDAVRMWGGKYAGFSPPSGSEIAAAVEFCRNHGPEASAAYISKLAPLVEKCRHIDDPELRFSAEDIGILKVFYQAWNSGDGKKPAGFSRGWEFSPGFMAALRLLFTGARQILLHQAARRTAAMRYLLNAYNILYRKNVLMQGNIRFADLPKLLSGAGGNDEWLNEIEYRMNCRFRHVLVDEFQDTSREQWAVLAPMTGDSGDGDHSLFVVGDVKQAIYGWRGGDSVLMEEVANEIAVSGGTEVQLLRSYRYGDGMISGLDHFFVNYLKNCHAFAPEIAGRWAHHYPVSASSARKGGSEMRIVAAVPESRQQTAGRSAVEYAAGVIAAVIREQQVIEKNLSCAILLRSGKKAPEFFEALSAAAPELREKLIISGKDSLGNDPFVAALLAAAVMLRHPGDRLAAEVVRMTPPLHRIMPDDHAGKQEWRQILDSGIAVFLTTVLKKLRYFHGKRVEEPCFWSAEVDLLLNAAAEFDWRCPGGEILTFRSEMQKYAAADAAIGGKIRIMTIHSSKGLTFDTVFVPFVDRHSDKNNLGGIDPGTFVADLSSPESGWILCNPGVEIIRSEPELLAAARKLQNQRAFEALCVLYVAMTRARYSTMVILPPLSKSVAGNFHPQWQSKKNKGGGRDPLRDAGDDSRYLDEMLFEAFFYDDDLFGTDTPLPEKKLGGTVVIERVFGEKWYPLPEKEAKEPVLPLTPPAGTTGGRSGRWRRLLPSQQEEPKLYFALPEKSSGTELGTEVHRFFEKMDYLDEIQPPENKLLRPHYDNCMRSPEISALLNERVQELWKERTFDVILPGGDGEKLWVSGCFDRVQICRDGDGTVQRVLIVDYKSNQCDQENVDELASHYAPQLEVYRRALAELLGITPNLIGCRLIFTAAGLVREV